MRDDRTACAKANEKYNILAVGAHPDDVECLCAGTLAKYAAEGHRVYIATATNGNIGSKHHSMEEIAAIRRREAMRSAAIIGAEYICLDYDDEMFYEDASVRMAFLNLLRHCRADIVFTHPLHDYNPDHMLTAKIVSDIAVMVPIAHLQTEAAPYAVIPSIWYCEPEASFGFVPTDYVDITDYYATKIRMLGCMESQKAWMADNYKQLDGDTDRFFDAVRITAEFRGMQAGCKYAEGFVRALDAYRTQLTQRVLP